MNSQEHTYSYKMSFDKGYTPYGDKDSPEHCKSSKSIELNPAVKDFEEFSKYMDYTIKRVNDIDRQTCYIGPTIYYRYRPWFAKMMRGYQKHSDITRFYQHRALSATDLGTRERNIFLVLQASLEVICSLMIFCQDDRFQGLTDREIERLHFPLSKSTREVIFSCSITEEDIGFNSYLMD